MPRIDGAAGPIPVGTTGTKTTDNPAATVQVGESKLSEVAQRLGIDTNSLQNANPQISDPAKLKVGQEINLPQFQPLQTLKQNDEAGLQSQGSQSGLPRAPIGDGLTKNVMQARLSATDLAQVPGGAHQTDIQQMKFANKVINSDKPLEANKIIGTEKAFHKADDLSQVSGGVKQVDIQHMKFADKMPTSDTLSNASKWSKADKPLDPIKTTGEEKAFQKADDLAQVAGGAGHVVLQQLQMKESRRAIPANKVIDADKVINADKTIKADKSAGSEKTFVKMDEATKIFEITQDVTVNKAKTADKAFDKMDGYIRQ
jgi:hypothetical protein